jgi:hypothetical protein
MEQFLTINSLEMNDFKFEVLVNSVDIELEKIKEEYIDILNDFNSIETRGEPTKRQSLGAKLVAKRKEVKRIIRQCSMSYLLNEVLNTREMTILTIQEIEKKLLGQKTHMKYYENINFLNGRLLHKKHPQGTKLKSIILEELRTLIIKSQYDYREDKVPNHIIGCLYSFHNKLILRFQNDFDLGGNTMLVRDMYEDYKEWKRVRF